MKKIVLIFSFLIFMVSCQDQSVDTESSTSNFNAGNLNGDTVVKIDPNPDGHRPDILEGEEAEALIQSFEDSDFSEEILYAEKDNVLLRCIVDESKILSARSTIESIKAKQEAVADFLTQEDVWELCQRELDILSAN